MSRLKNTTMMTPSKVKRTPKTTDVIEIASSLPTEYQVDPIEDQVLTLGGTPYVLHMNMGVVREVMTKYEGRHIIEQPFGEVDKDYIDIDFHYILLRALMRTRHGDAAPTDAQFDQWIDRNNYLEVLLALQLATAFRDPFAKVKEEIEKRKVDSGVQVPKEAPKDEDPSSGPAASSWNSGPLRA
jgi:hypothetical protein